MAGKSCSDKTRFAQVAGVVHRVRQAMCADTHKRTGIYFGIHRRVWGDATEGESWQCIARYFAADIAITAIGLTMSCTVKIQPVTLVHQRCGRSVNAKGASVTEVLADLDVASPVCALE